MTSHIQIAKEILPDVGSRSFLKAGNKSIVLFNEADEFYAIEDHCPHQGASLFTAKVEKCVIQCPVHGLRFNLKDGCMQNSNMLKIKTYPIEVHAEHILIMLEDGVEP